MATPTKKRATYQDVLDAPPDKVAEIIGGELRLFPRPAGPHGRVSTLLGGELHGPFDRGRGGPGGWVFIDEPELHFNGDIVVPDLAAWRRERMPVVPDAAFFTLAPDWICEVLSPSTERTDRADKLPFYAAFGVRHVWFVNPRLRTLEVLVHRDAWTILAVHAGDARVRVEPFVEVELDLTVLWAELPLPTRAGEPASAELASSVW